MIGKPRGNAKALRGMAAVGSIKEMSSETSPAMDATQLLVEYSRVSLTLLYSDSDTG